MRLDRNTDLAALGAPLGVINSDLGHAATAGGLRQMLRARESIGATSLDRDADENQPSSGSTHRSDAVPAP